MHKWKHIIRHVIHHNDRIVKPYHNQKKNVEKNNFRYHGNHKTVNFWWFSLFFRIFLLPPQKFGAGVPDMGHVIHWNDHLVNPYHFQKLEKNDFRYHGNHKTVYFWWFSLFFRIFLFSPQGFRGKSPQHGSGNTPKWTSSQSLSFSKENKKFRYHGNPKKCQFGMIFPIFWIFLLPLRGSWAGPPNMGHVTHQTDHLIKLYHIQKKKLKKYKKRCVIRIWLQLLCLILDGVTRICSSWTL